MTLLYLHQVVLREDRLKSKTLKNSQQARIRYA